MPVGFVQTPPVPGNLYALIGGKSYSRKSNLATLRPFRLQHRDLARPRLVPLFQTAPTADQ
jgi:hypothetical protein